jgi:L-2-hydroxyglutarate oxidase LhgO
MLAFGREAYEARQFNLRDLADTLTWPGFWREIVRPEFRNLIGKEIGRTLSVERIWQEASRFVPRLSRHALIRSFAGIRAQLMSKEGRLVDDIVVRTTPRGVHVLNAVSPGLTCSLPFADHLAGIAEGLL